MGFKRYLLLSLSLIISCQAQTQPNVINKTKEVTLRILNKITGQAVTLKTTLLKPVRYDNLIIRPRECFKKKVGIAYEINWSFIEAWVQKSPYQLTNTSLMQQYTGQKPAVTLVFSAWLNSVSPNFSHPDYGVTIQGCEEIVLANKEKYNNRAERKESCS